MIEKRDATSIIDQCSLVWKIERTQYDARWYKHPIILITFNIILKILMLVTCTILFRAILYPLIIGPMLICIGTALKAIGLG